ncbi:MAG TPA: EcsC family protein [Chitinophagaceae bacterium]|nr:EcsC family protein [Chitinophagaceae bacterium]
MDPYLQRVTFELNTWQKQMLKRPSFFNNLSKDIQTKINSWIPEKVHNAITVTLKQMIRGVLFGARHTTGNPLKNASLKTREGLVQKKIDVYRHTAAIEGGITGAGGLLLGLADFPILIGIKIKLLFEIASLYGFDIHDYKERVYLLHIFELAFSSHEHRRNVYLKMTDWDDKKKHLPEDINQFDWRNFQQEYRDYIDIAKMAQLIPAIGAPVGIVVNNKLVKKLGVTAMNAYRMRVLSKAFSTER